MPTLARNRIKAPTLPFPLDLELEGFTLVNFALPPGRLDKVLPSELVPVTQTLDGEEVAWLSVFIGRNILRRVGSVPALPVRFKQVNYRIYIALEEGHGLYIFRSVIGSDLVAQGARLFPQLPAVSLPFRFDLEWQRDRMNRVAAEVGTGGSELSLVAEYAGEAPETAGFESPESAVSFLANVPEAYFPTGEGRYGVLVSQHPPMHPKAGTLTHAHFGWLQKQGILTEAEAQHPASVFLQGHADFPTYM